MPDVDGVAFHHAFWRLHRLRPARVMRDRATSCPRHPKSAEPAIRVSPAVAVRDDRVLVSPGCAVSLAVTLTRAQEGVSAPQVMVEVHLSGGLPGTHIVGLPEAAVREARDRVRVAIQNAAFEYPNRKVTVNLAPAELPKDGGRFDLAIALGILAAGGQVPREKLDECEFLGELALSGDLRGVSGVLPGVIAP